MTLDLSNLTPTDAEMPVSTRGRKAVELPAWLTEAVEASYTMDPGTGKQVTIPPGEISEKTGADANVTYFVGQLRRAVEAYDPPLGISVALGERHARKGTVVTFRAKDRNRRRTEEGGEAAVSE